jgi:hypothetical protein
MTMCSDVHIVYRLRLTSKVYFYFFFFSYLFFLILVEKKFLSYNLMLNSGKIFFDLHDKKINILTLVLSEKKFLNETKNHNPPFKLNGRSLISSVLLYCLSAAANSFLTASVLYLLDFLFNFL